MINVVFAHRRSENGYAGTSQDIRWRSKASVFAHFAEFCRPLLQFKAASFLSRMAFNTLKHRYVAQVNRMFERFVSLVAALAFAVSQATEVDRMLNG